jgi:AcrR family transcriptional regulator
LPRQDRAERTRNVILDAAAEAFEARGFAGASLSDILSRAGVTKGALYFHFASKEELAKEIVEAQWNFEIPSVENSANPMQDLIDLSHAFCHSLCTNIRMRASNRLVAEANFDQPYPQVYSRWITVIREHLEAARENGDLRQEWDVEEVAAYIGGAVLGIQTMSGVLNNRTDLRDRLIDMWKISLPGLVPARRLSRYVPSGNFQWDSSAA